jgi:hypothetical protein
VAGTANTNSDQHGRVAIVQHDCLRDGQTNLQQHPRTIGDYATRSPQPHSPRHRAADVYAKIETTNPGN